MDDAQLGRIIRALRHRRGWRQADLARRAGCSAGVIGLIERGHADGVSVRVLRRTCAVLDVRLAWDIGHRGPELSRLGDADHAALADWLAMKLEALGWRVAAEVSFNQYGDRGRIDLLAHEPITRTLLVIEVKTVIVDIQYLLGALDVKARLGPTIARSMHWSPTRTVRMLAVVDGTTNRRRIADHQRLFARFTVRGAAAMAWLRKPGNAPDGLLLFAKLPNRKLADVRRAGRQRVRVGGGQAAGVELGQPR